MGRVHWFTAPNVLGFNNLLKEICRVTLCLYIDCFRDFVLEDGTDHDYYLFRDWLHLNKRGVGILYIWIKFIINNDPFNPIMSGNIRS